MSGPISEQELQEIEQDLFETAWSVAWANDCIPRLVSDIRRLRARLEAEQVRSEYLSAELSGANAIKRTLARQKIYGACANFLCSCGAILQNAGDEEPHMGHIIEQPWVQRLYDEHTRRAAEGSEGKQP